MSEKQTNRSKPETEPLNVTIRAITDAELGRPFTGVPDPPVGTCREYILSHRPRYCERKLLEGSEYCYWHAPTKTKYSVELLNSYFGPGVSLPKAIRTEIVAGRSLDGAYLADAPLGGNWTTPGCDLSGGTFARADFSGAHLSYCNLAHANFAYSNLENARLSECCLTRTHFSGARLFRAKFRRNDFSDVQGLTRENFYGLKWGRVPVYQLFEEYPDQCEVVYRRLGTYFTAQGLLDDASWAAYRSRVMRHKVLRKRLSPVYLWSQSVIDSAMYEKPLKLGIFPIRKFGIPWLSNLWSWWRSLALMTVMGYGEKPLRVIANAAFVIASYGIFYFLTGAINDKTFLGSLYFSIVTFTTLGYGDLIPRGPFRLVAASEALLGIFLCGLFLFCLGRRSVGRT